MTEVRTTSATGGQKGVKPARHSLIPAEALNILAELYGKGAEKYADHNWRKGYEWSKSYDSMQRHATSFWAGEDIDPDTGMPNLACVAFHAFTLMIFANEQPQFDDRYKPESFASDEAIAELREKLTGSNGWVDSTPSFETLSVPEGTESYAPYVATDALA